MVYVQPQVVGAVLERYILRWLQISILISAAGYRPFFPRELLKHISVKEGHQILIY